MAKKSIAKSALPIHLKKHLETLGKNLQTARKRRQMTQKELASRLMCSLPTIGRLESGDPGISLNILLQALWVFGMEDQITDLASPGNDTVGIQKEIRNLPRRIRNSPSEDKLDF